jgi:hypothetical protein
MARGNKEAERMWDSQNGDSDGMPWSQVEKSELEMKASSEVQGAS